MNFVPFARPGVRRLGCAGWAARTVAAHGAWLQHRPHTQWARLGCLWYGQVRHDAKIWDVDGYPQLWGSDGKSVQKARSALAARRTHAIQCLTTALEFRKEDIKKHARDPKSCKGPPNCAIPKCKNCKSRCNHAFMFRLLDESRIAMSALPP